MQEAVLDKELKSLREKHFQLRTQSVTEKVQDTSQFKKIKRDIARVLTEQRARRK
jgi:large subunit ribosomal protein L29